jgi:hypothetical protein
MAVRRAERWRRLMTYRLTDCRIRFLADLVFGTPISSDTKTDDPVIPVVRHRAVAWAWNLFRKSQSVKAVRALTLLRRGCTFRPQ